MTSFWGFHSLYSGFKDVLFCAIYSKPNAQLINHQQKPCLNKSSQWAGEHSTDPFGFTPLAQAAWSSPELFPSITKCRSIPPFPLLITSDRSGLHALLCSRTTPKQTISRTHRGNGPTPAWRRPRYTPPSQGPHSGRPVPQDSSAPRQLHLTWPRAPRHHTMFQQHFCTGSRSDTGSGEGGPAIYRLRSETNCSTPACIIWPVPVCNLPYSIAPLLQQLEKGHLLWAREDKAAGFTTEQINSSRR